MQIISWKGKIGLKNTNGDSRHLGSRKVASGVFAPIFFLHGCNHLHNDNNYRMYKAGNNLKEIWKSHRGNSEWGKKTVCAPFTVMGRGGESWCKLVNETKTVQTETWGKKKNRTKEVTKQKICSSRLIDWKKNSCRWFWHQPEKIMEVKRFDQWLCGRVSWNGKVVQILK